jgi:hypothetical protein
VINPSQRSLPYSTQHLQQTNIHDPVGFETTISACEQPKTDVLDRAATGIGFYAILCVLYFRFSFYGSRTAKGPQSFPTILRTGVLVSQTVNTAARQIYVQTKLTLHLVRIAFCVSANHIQLINKHAYWSISVPPLSSAPSGSRRGPASNPRPLH